MKKPLKYLIYLLTLVLAIIIYFYLKPAIEVKQLTVENNVPIKIGPYSSPKGNDSVLIYIPYKFRVSNNRLKKIEFGIVMFNNNYSNSNEDDLHFDTNGYILQPFYNNGIFPFSDKEYYFYKPFLVNKSTIAGLTDFNAYTSLVSNFINYQKKKLYNESSFKVKKQTRDSLYQSSRNTKIILNYDSENKNNYSNGYEVEYYLDTNKQTLIDNSKMTREELEKHLSSNPFEK